MKRIVLIMTTIFSLITTFVVSSFAWFQLRNNGVLSTDISTRKEIAVYFSQEGTNGEFMTPAKLKKGVINNPNGSINGDTDVIDENILGNNLLPKSNNWVYEVNDGKLVPKNEYIESPATIVYSQFQVQMSTIDENYLSTEKLSLSFYVKFYNVNADTNDISKATLFTQMQALKFNFFVLEQELNEEQLKRISTYVKDVGSNEMIEKYVVDNQVRLVNDDGVSNDELNYEDVDSYRYHSIIDDIEKKYTVSFNNLNVNQVYYILIESYYNLPDELVKGNLPLTGKFVLDMKYTSSINKN